MSAVDSQLLSRILDEHGPALELFARQRCRSAADVVQEALVQLARQTSVPENLVSWLYRVVRNGAISAARAEERRRRHEHTASELRSWFCRTAPGEIDGTAATEQLAQLPIEEREAIVAHLWGGLSFEEIAQLQESSSSTAHRRYQTGLETLRRNLGAPCLNQKNRKTN